MTAELPVSFLCEKDRMYGVLHLPGKPAKHGILMIQGRPAYRVGTHRVYVDLARAWAAHGYPVMRMDYRGSGDSEGPVPMYEDTPREIRAAVDAYMANMPGLEEVVVWGSCAGAADAITYALTDPRITAMGFLNLWAYSARDRARTRIRYHAGLYLRKMRNPSWWKTMFRGEVGLKASIRELFLTLREAAGGKAGPLRTYKAREELDGVSSLMPEDAMRFYHTYRVPDLAERLGNQLLQFRGKLMLVLCGGDVIAQSFLSMAEANPVWKKVLTGPSLTRHDLHGADHGLRRPEWRAQVIQWSLEWFAQL